MLLGLMQAVLGSFPGYLAGPAGADSATDARSAYYGYSPHENQACMQGVLIDWYDLADVVCPHLVAPPPPLASHAPLSAVPPPPLPAACAG